jgi:hypothetical protein
MVSENLNDLARRIEAAADVDAATSSLALEQVEKSLTRIGIKPQGDWKDLSSTDHVLHLVDQAAPGWSIHLDGKAFEPNGHWRCTLRPSDMRDDDEFIATAKGPRLVNVLVAAFLRLLAHISRSTGQ